MAFFLANLSLLALRLGGAPPGYTYNSTKPVTLKRRKKLVFPKFLLNQITVQNWLDW